MWNIWSTLRKQLATIIAKRKIQIECKVCLYISYEFDAEIIAQNKSDNVQIMLAYPYKNKARELFVQLQFVID